MNIHKINQTANAFPYRLLEISSPPKQLYAVGNLKLLTEPDKHWVAIVGSRTPSPYGEQVTYQLAAELAAHGIIIVSGLALGIDARAHQAAVDQGMPTVAVLPCGLDQVYPGENQQLSKDILANNGLLLSEYVAGTRAYRQNFVARNRLVSGLTDILLVTEAAELSGTRHTVTFANSENKTVMAVPGNITSPKSAGANNIIKTGAKPVTAASDVMLELGFQSGLNNKPVQADSREEALLLNLLREGVNRSEELIARSGLTASQFANLISLMEISGKVHNLGAGVWVIRGT